MKKLFSLIVLAAMLPAMSYSQEQADLESMARNFFDHFLNKNVEAMEEMLGDQFKKMIPAGQLKEIAEGIEGQLGKYSHVVRSVYQKAGAYEVIILVARFGEMDWGVNLTFDQNRKIQGFLINVAPPEQFTPPPAYADSSRFTETEMKVDCGDIKLPAILTMPVTGENVPIVVLVHGSGPHDKDQTIGPNKIFRDIAQGLATRGIAVLRYEKRTFRRHNSLDLNNITVWEEAGKDAVAAIRAAGQLPGIDGDRIYLAGHSLGGMIAPRIAQEATELAGIISLAGTPRYLYELIPEQLQYLAELRDDTSEESMQQIEEARQMAAGLANKRKNPEAVYETSHIGLPPSYWQDLNRFDTGTIAASLPQRILVIQGGRDYQVTVKDFEAWEKALKNHHDTAFFLFDDLDHLFFKGEGLSNPATYFQEGNVDERVIIAISNWINKL